MFYAKIDTDETGRETVTTVTTNGGRNSEGYRVNYAEIINGILKEPEKATRIDIDLDPHELPF